MAMRRPSERTVRNLVSSPEVVGDPPRSVNSQEKVNWLSREQELFVVQEQLRVIFARERIFVDLEAVDELDEPFIASIAMTYGLVPITHKDKSNGFEDQLRAEGYYVWDATAPNCPPKRIGNPTPFSMGDSMEASRPLFLPHQ